MTDCLNQVVKATWIDICRYTGWRTCRITLSWVDVDLIFDWNICFSKLSHLDINWNIYIYIYIQGREQLMSAFGYRVVFMGWWYISLVFHAPLLETTINTQRLNFYPLHHVVFSGSETFWLKLTEWRMV